MIANGFGCVVRTLGETLLAALPGARIGDGVRIFRAGAAPLAGEIASVERGRVAIVPFGTLRGIGVGDRVEIDGGARAVPVGFAALGRCIDGCGRALDGRPDPSGAMAAVDRAGAPLPGARLPVTMPLWTGIRAIDALLTVGQGARIGIFGAPGAGKTTLLESVVAGASADAVVLALVGERGREAAAWLARAGSDTTIVCATSDRSATERVRAAEAAMTHAEYLRERGLHVVLIVDSLARYAAALREQRVSLGEPVGRGGYPAAVWAELARYLERAGNGSRGSISLIATVLSDGSDEREPLSDAARSLLDGHIVLSAELAAAGHYPAIDVLASTSRTMPGVARAIHARDAALVRAALALLAETKDARAFGVTETSERVGIAVAAENAIAAFVRQREPTPARDTLVALHDVAARCEMQ